MHIRVGYEIVYECPQPTPMLLTLNLHYTRASDILITDNIVTQPSLPITAYRDDFGNWCSRIVAPAGITRISTDALIKDTGLTGAVHLDALQHAVEDLPSDTLVYLLGSRYCETDKLSETAWQLFNQTPLGWQRVQAICDFVHNHITFGYQYARSTKTAFEAYNERLGVCRDYTHLAITFCRCMNIPARYCTGYLGDIGVPLSPNPMDFSAWFEVYLGGRWHTFDARNNIPRIGYILLARGRDATDVPITNVFGPNVLQSFKVWTDEVVN